jgi:DNA-binding IclR family transcriptional regulator
MAIFEIFGQQRRDLSNSDVARLLGIAETSSLDLLHTLAEQGYLARTLRTRRFYPTGRLLAMAKRISENDPIFAIGTDTVEALVEMTAETALCGRMEGSAVKVIALREGQHELRYIQRVGAKIAAHASALGKALLAALPEPELKSVLQQKALKKLTSSTVTDPVALRRSLAEIRKRGWASVYGEGTDGVAALAVAGRVGDEMIAFSLAGPSERLRRNEKTYVKALQEVGDAVFTHEAMPVRSAALAAGK